MSTTISISRRFCGPPDSANGGYAAGTLASVLDGAVEVRLRAPPPLDLSLETRTGEGGAVRLCCGEQVIAEARGAVLECPVPEPLDFERATSWSAHYRGFAWHAFGHCFVCGPAREPGDGLRIFAGRPSASGPVAAPWIPDDNLAGPDGVLPDAIVWAAIDCPGYFAHTLDTMALLGTMTGEVVRPVRAGQRYVVMGWSRGQDGRKYLSGSALFTDDGALCARATQIWIVPRAA